MPNTECTANNAKPKTVKTAKTQKKRVRKVTAKRPESQLTEMDAKTFAATLGQAVWLMAMSEDHQDQRIGSIEESVALPILLRQFRLFSKNNQPVAFLTFACVSDEVRARIDAGDKTLTPAEWRSGPHVVVIDCVSPFNPPERFVERFQADAASAVSASA